MNEKIIVETPKGPVSLRNILEMEPGEWFADEDGAIWTCCCTTEPDRYNDECTIPGHEGEERRKQLKELRITQEDSQ